MAQRPNIVFIVADDLGFADLGCYGGREAEFGPVSPVLDGLAAAGLKFTQGYANSPVCSPTRFALMTGRYQYRLRGAAEEPINSKSRGSATLGLPPEHPTLPSLLRDAGYRTALIGKWHLGYPPHFSPLKSGYQRFFGPMSGGVDYFSHCDSRGTHDLWQGEQEHREDGYLTDMITDRAVQWLGEVAGSAGGDQPFFLSLHYTAPHWPWETRDDAALAEEVQDNLFHLHGDGSAAPGRGRSRHAGGFHQRQRWRAFLRQLAARGRQDGPDRRRYPCALDRALAGGDRTRRRQRPAMPDDGLERDDTRRCRRGCRR